MIPVSVLIFMDIRVYKTQIIVECPLIITPKGQTSWHVKHCLVLLVFCANIPKIPSRTTYDIERKRQVERYLAVFPTNSSWNDLENIDQVQQSLRQPHPLCLWPCVQNKNNPLWTTRVCYRADTTRYVIFYQFLCKVIADWRYKSISKQMSLPPFIFLEAIRHIRHFLIDKVFQGNTLIPKQSYTWNI